MTFGYRSTQAADRATLLEMLGVITEVPESGEERGMIGNITLD